LSFKYVSYVLLYQLLGAGLAVQGSYLFIFLSDYLKANGLLLGLCMIFSVLLEIPIYFYGETLISYYGYKKILLYSISGHLIRLFGYTLINSAWYVLPLEFLHGAISAAAGGAAVQYVSSISPKGLESTAQGILMSSYSCGMFLGTLIGGYVFNTYGPYYLFKGTACVMIMGMLLFMKISSGVNYDAVKINSDNLLIMWILKLIVKGNWW